MKNSAKHADGLKQLHRRLLRDGTVKPVVAGVFSFEEAGAAQNMITERRNVGKVVLVPGG